MGQVFFTVILIENIHLGPFCPSTLLSLFLPDNLIFNFCSRLWCCLVCATLPAVCSYISKGNVWGQMFIWFVLYNLTEIINTWRICIITYILHVGIMPIVPLRCSSPTYTTFFVFSRQPYWVLSYNYSQIKMWRRWVIPSAGFSVIRSTFCSAGDAPRPSTLCCLSLEVLLCSQ